MMSATKVAPPKIYRIINDSNVIASECNERGNQQAWNPDQARIPTSLIASLTLAMTDSQNLWKIPNVAIFSRGTRGTTCEAFPLSPFDPQSLARSSIVCAPHGLCQCSTAHASMLRLRLEHRRCALWLGVWNL
ncbi:MAG: hypothetical protein K2N70_07955 [Helicobacter sp.]|nr:hypothetical protein [Helicobacter sp.]